MTTKEPNVLVVEDDPQTLSLERQILEGGGYTVASAIRGEEAIEMVADASPDLILLDIGLPGIDGFTTCKVIRKFSRVPIIMVTGSNSLSDKVRGLDVGADDYIGKPFSEAELFARSKAVLRRSNPGSRQLRQANSQLRKGLGSVGSIDYAGKAHMVLQGAGKLLSALVNWGRTRQVPGLKSASNHNKTVAGKPARWQTWLRAALLQFLNLFDLFCYGLLLLARCLKKYLRRWWDSSLMSRVKATRPAIKLADAASRFRQSEFGQQAVSDASHLWEAGKSTASGFLSQREKIEGPQTNHQAIAVSVAHAPEAVASPEAPEVTHPEQRVFLEKLLRAYLREAETRFSDPMISAPVLALVDVYQQMETESGEGEEYSREQFVRDVYLLHSSGIDCTSTGARVQFPISRGVPNKTFAVTDDAGVEIKYYGVRFTQTSGSDSQCLKPGRPFIGEEASGYSEEIKEALCRQLEWPSEAFARLIADQLNFGELEQRDIRQFAQITRDSVQELLKECSGKRAASEIADGVAP